MTDAVPDRRSAARTETRVEQISVTTSTTEQVTGEGCEDEPGGRGDGGLTVAAHKPHLRYYRATPSY
jgi:hypothetical protein